MTDHVTTATAAAPATPVSKAPYVPSPDHAKHLRQIQWLAVGSLLALIALGFAWELFLAPIRPGGSWLALKVLPLCIPLAGFLKNRMYTYRWVSMMVWVYFAEGATRAWSDRPPSNYLAMIEVVLCVILFIACALHVRLRVGGR